MLAKIGKAEERIEPTIPSVGKRLRFASEVQRLCPISKSIVLEPAEHRGKETKHLKVEYL
jgi:hypothetical protein